MAGLEPEGRNGNSRAPVSAAGGRVHDIIAAPAQFRMVLISFLAAGVGLVAGLIAFALYRLIGLFTNLAFYGRFTSDFTSARHNHLGLWVILIPVIGGIIVGGLPGADGRAGVGGAGGPGGTASTQMISYLEAHRDGATWLVAVQGSSAAASIILATGGIPVMAMGGFRGTDAAPALAQLEQYVKQGKLHYVLAGGRGEGGFGGGAGTVTSWVEQNCTAVPASAYGAAASVGAAAPGEAGTGAGGLYHCG